MGVVLANTLFTEDLLQDVVDSITNFHLLAEEFGFVVVAGLNIIEDV